MRNHGDRVYRLAFRLSGNRADAEDLTQETFVRVFRSLSDFTPGTFEGWLHRITTNLFLDMVRRRGRIRFDALPEDAADRLPARTAGPEQTYAENHLDPEIQSALDSLPADFRAAVVLCDLEELSLRGDRRDPERQGRHRALPHPPRSGPAPRGAGPPRARRPSARAGTGLMSWTSPITALSHLSDEAVAAFADGVLSDTARQRAQSHMAGCAECSEAVYGQRAARAALRSALQPAPAGRAVRAPA